MDVACVRNVCMCVHFEQGYDFYIISKHKKLVLNIWWNGDITCVEQWGYLFIHATNHAADKATI